MRGLLFGTTALASAVLLAPPADAEAGIKLGLSGYLGIFFGAGDIDTDFADFTETGMYRDGEVHFAGETALDNGLSVGANIQLESLGSSPDQIDQNFGYIEGGFGRAEFGSRNTAAYLMQFAAPFVGAPINSGWVTAFVPQPPGHDGAFLSPGVSTFVDTGDDENALTYFTPRLFGLQLGLSYQPAVVFSGDGKNFPVYADEDSEYNNGVSVGVNFVESFGGVEIALAAGYRRAEGPEDDIVALVDSGVAGTNNTGRVQTFERDDIEQWSAGMNIGFGGFTLGGSYAAETSGLVTPLASQFGTTGVPGAAGVIGPLATTFPPPFTVVSAADPASFTSGARSTEGWSWDAGLTYEAEPWKFGVGFFQGVAEGDLSNGEQDVMYAAQGGIGFAVGPGVTASLSGIYASWDSEDGVDSHGFAGIFGVELLF